MTIFLMILKIIGWTILILFLVLLILILLCLFSPITYRVNGSIQEKQYLVNGSASWLLRLIGIHFNVQDNEISLVFRLLFFKKKLLEPNEEESESPKDDIYVSETEQPTEQDTDIVRENNLEAASTQNDFDAQKEKEHVSHSKKMGTIWNKIKKSYQNLILKYKSFKKKFHRIERLIENEENQKAFTHVKKNVWKLLCMVVPKKLKLNANYSTGSPDTTALTFGILAMFPIGYTNRWSLVPDFNADGAYIEGDMKVMGRIYPIVPLILFLGLFFDRKCRRLYKRIRKL